jgi:hypothetical protein
VPLIFVLLVLLQYNLSSLNDWTLTGGRFGNKVDYTMHPRRKLKLIKALNFDPVTLRHIIAEA